VSDEAARRLARALAGGGLAEIVIWDRGGSPGPSYESNQLTTVDDGTVLHAVFLKTRFDQQNPPFRSEEYAHDFPRLKGSDKLMMAIFGRTYAEEKDPRIGGVTKITITARLVGAPEADALSKTFYQQLPSELASLDTRFREMLRVCEEEGALTRLPRPGEA
jgi:hypothetical protein